MEAEQLVPMPENIYNAFNQLAQHLNVLGQTQQQLYQQLVQLHMQPAAPQSPDPHAHADHNSAMSVMAKHVKPPTFCGEKDANELEVWLSQMEEYFLIIEPPALSDLQKIMAAGMFLKGQAASWYLDVRRRPHSLCTWDEFVQEIKQVFMPVNLERIARDRLASVYQREKDTLAAYTTYMHRLFLAIPNITEDEKLDRYVRGLLPFIRKETIIQDPKTFDQAVVIATKANSIRLLLTGRGNRY